jgi:AraC-like DNA-binding protein
MPDHDRSSGRLALESGDPASPTGLSDDFLSQILGLIRLGTVRVFAAELAAPWALSFAAGSACLHLVETGQAQVTTADGRKTLVRAGDVILLPQESAHVMNAGEAAPMPLELALARHQTGVTLHLPGAGATTRLVTATFRFQGDNLSSMLAVLPPFIHIPAGSEGGDWLADVARVLLAEAREARAGVAILAARLIDALVIQAMRLWVRNATPEDRGWLGALADPRIARVLKAIHDAPFHIRSVGELANLAGMSRSSFAERFALLIGAPPLHYQTRWRLLLAHQMLQRSDARVSEIGRQIGYDSEAAFSRAYKAQFGHPPAMTRGSLG